MILQLELLNTDLIEAAATYKAAVSCRNKALLLAINVTLKILAVRLQDHQIHSYMALNLNPALKSQASI